jgi:hypothetical protein
MGYSELKQILRAAPIGIQLRHIRNMSWIEKRIIEILVDVRHVQAMRNRISLYSDYMVKTRFDPLSSDCFNWEEGILPESKIRILQTNFVSRLSTSLAQTSDHYSKQCISDFVRNRGLGQQFERELKRKGISLPSTAPLHESSHAGPSRIGPKRYTMPSVSNESSVKEGATKYRKRKLSTSSKDDGER